MIAPVSDLLTEGYNYNFDIRLLVIEFQIIYKILLQISEKLKDLLELLLATKNLIMMTQWQNVLINSNICLKIIDSRCLDSRIPSNREG